MKAKDLIDILGLNPEADVYAINTRYNGDSDESDMLPAKVITNGDDFVIASNDLHDLFTAVSSMAAITVGTARLWEMAKIENDGHCIYVD